MKSVVVRRSGPPTSASGARTYDPRRDKRISWPGTSAGDSISWPVTSAGDSISWPVISAGETPVEMNSIQNSHYLLVQNTRQQKLGIKSDGLTISGSPVKTSRPSAHTSGQASTVTSTLCYNTSTQTDSPFSLGRNFPWSNNFRLVSIVDTSPPMVNVKGKHFNEKAIQTGVINDKNYFTQNNQLLENGHYKDPSVSYSSGKILETQSQYVSKEVLRNNPSAVFKRQRHNIVNKKSALYNFKGDHPHVSDERSESVSSDLSDDDTLCGKEEAFTDQDNHSVSSRPTSHLGISRQDLISMPGSNDLKQNVSSWIEKNQYLANSPQDRNHLWHDKNAHQRINMSNLSAMINSSQTRLDILQDKIHHSNSPMQLGRYSALQTTDHRGGLDLSSKTILTKDEHDLSMTSDLGSEISSAYTHRWSSSLGQLHSRASSFASTVESAQNNEHETVVFPKHSSSPYLWGRITQHDENRLGRYRRESDSVFLDDDLGINDNVVGSIESNHLISNAKYHFKEDLGTALGGFEDMVSSSLMPDTLLKNSLEKSVDKSPRNHELIHIKEVPSNTIVETDEVLYRRSFQNDGGHVHKATEAERHRLSEILARYSRNNPFDTLSNNLSEMNNQHTINSSKTAHIPPDMNRRMSDYSLESVSDSTKRPDFTLSSNRSKSSSSLLSDSVYEQHSSIAQRSSHMISKTNGGYSEVRALSINSATIPDLQASPSRNLFQEDDSFRNRNSMSQTSSTVFAPDSVAEVISAVHENLARSTERMGCLRRLSSASSRASFNLTDSRPDRSRKETEWTRLRALTSHDYRPESDRLTSRHSLDLGVYLDSVRAISPNTRRSSVEEGTVEKSDFSSMDNGLLVSPRYQIDNVTSGLKPESSRSQLQQQLNEAPAPPIVPPRRSRQKQQPAPSTQKESPKEEESSQKGRSSKEEHPERRKQQEQIDLDKRLEASPNQVSFSSYQEKTPKLELTVLHKSPHIQETSQQRKSSSQEDSPQEKESTTQQDSAMQQRSSKQALHSKEINRMQPIPLAKHHEAENQVENSKINFQDLLKQWNSSSPVDSSGSQDEILKGRKLNDSNSQQPWDQRPQWQVSSVPASYELSRTNISIASTYKRQPAQKQESTSPPALTMTSVARPPSSLYLPSSNFSAWTIAQNSSTPSSSFKPLSATPTSQSPHSTTSNIVSNPSHHNESYQRTPRHHPFVESGITSTPSKGPVDISTSLNRTEYFQGGSSSGVVSTEVGSGSSKLTANARSSRSSIHQDTRVDRFGAPQTSSQSRLHLIRESPKVAGTGLTLGQPATGLSSDRGILQNGHHSTEGHTSQIIARKDGLMSHTEVARRNSRTAGMYRRSNSSSVLLSNTAPTHTDNQHSPISFLPPESNLTQQCWTSELVLSNFGSPDTASSPSETTRFNNFRRDTSNLARNYATDSATLALPVRPPRPRTSNRHNPAWTPSTSPADSRAQVPSLGDSLSKRAISASLSELSNISIGPTPPREQSSSFVSGESPQRRTAERDPQAPTAMFDSRQSFPLTPERAQSTYFFPNNQHMLNENPQSSDWTHTLPLRGYEDFRAPLLSGKSSSPKSGTSNTSDSTKPPLSYDSNPFFRSGDNMFPKQVTPLPSNSDFHKTSIPVTPQSRSPNRGKVFPLQNASQLKFSPHLLSETCKTSSLEHLSNHSTPPDSQPQTSQPNTSQEGYEDTTQQVFRELSDKDRKLVDVLLQTSNQRRMLYMEGLFSDVLGPGSKLSLQQRPPSPLSIKGNTMSRQRSMDSFKRNSLPRDYRTSTSQTSSDVPDKDGPAGHQNLSRTSSDSASCSHPSLSRTSSDCGDRAALLKLKEELLDKLQKKVDVMKEERVRLQRLADENNLFGEKVCKLVEGRCSSWNQVDKLRSHLDDLDKIVRLLLNLSGQLSRAENAVQALSPDTNRQLKKQAKDKRDQLFARHEEAQQLKKSIDRRSEQLASFLQEVLTQHELADYRTFTQTKSKLLIELQQVQDQITIAEQQMSAIQHSLPEQHTSENKKEDCEKLDQEQQPQDK